MSSVKIYTKKGDRGTSSLYDSRKPTTKSDTVFEVLGDIDELSAHLGAVAIHSSEDNPLLRKIQVKLLDIGSVVATANTARAEAWNITDKDVKTLESHIDEYEKKNTPLKEFILPGINPANAQCHIARAVARRLERHYIKLLEKDDERLENHSVKLARSNPCILKYLNRVSDLLFVLARKLGDCQETTRSQA